MNTSDVNLFYARIQTELKNLPGEAAHMDMIPFRKRTSEVLKQPVDYRLSAVLLLLYAKENVPHFILTERQQYNGKHSGQISLPGGKTEPGDANTQETALREAEEEIGIDRNSVMPLGNMTPVYIPVSNFLIHPYVGFIEQPPVIMQDEREVKSVLHCSTPELLNEDNRILTQFQMENGVRMKNIPAFDLQQKVVWGATAIILNEFKFILQRFS